MYQGRRRLSKSGWAILLHLFWSIPIPTPTKIKKCFENLSEFIGFFKFKFGMIRRLRKQVQRDVLRFPPKNWVGNCRPRPPNSYVLEFSSQIDKMIWRIPLRLDQKIGHSTEIPVLITDQPCTFIFFLTGTKIYHKANKNKT